MIKYLALTANAGIVCVETYVNTGKNGIYSKNERKNENDEIEKINR